MSKLGDTPHIDLDSITIEGNTVTLKRPSLKPPYEYTDSIDLYGQEVNDNWSAVFDGLHMDGPAWPAAQRAREAFDRARQAMVKLQSQLDQYTGIPQLRGGRVELREDLGLLMEAFCTELEDRARDADDYDHATDVLLTGIISILDDPGGYKAARIKLEPFIED